MEILRQYYEKLGITPGVSFEQIKQAYKDLVSVWHPDRFESNPRLKEKAQEKIKEINAAYEKLSIFFREYGAPSFENPPDQQSQKSSNDSYKEPPVQPEEPVSPAQNKYKYKFKEAIWNPNAAAAWSLVFSPAFGSFLHVLNWGTLKQPDRASSAKNWFYASLAIPVIYLFLIFIVADSGAFILANVIAIFWLIVWYFAFAREQVKYVNEKFGANYPRKSWDNALLAGIAGSFVYFIVYLVFASAAG